MQDLHEQESLAMLKLAQDFPGLSFDHPQSEDPKKVNTSLLILIVTIIRYWNKQIRVG